MPGKKHLCGDALPPAVRCHPAEFMLKTSITSGGISRASNAKPFASEIAELLFDDRCNRRRKQTQAIGHHLVPR